MLVAPLLPRTLLLALTNENTTKEYSERLVTLETHDQSDKDKDKDKDNDDTEEKIIKFRLMLIIDNDHLDLQTSLVSKCLN